MRRTGVSLPVLHVAEPPPAYLGRPPIVIDCSVLSALLFEEETRDAAGKLLVGKTLHAPLLLDSEIVSVATKKQRAGGPPALIARALVDYGGQAIEFHRPDVETQYALSLRYGISPYDAAYLCVAALLQAPLATFDAKLAKAARIHLSGPS